MPTVELAYEIFGEQHDGTPLLILHGFMASSRNWRAIARRLAGQRRVYVPDMRNHGTSPHHRYMDYPAMAEDLLVFMRRRGIDSVDILGHSMGGKIAMWFALHYPQHVNRLIVADIAPVNYEHNFDGTIQALQNLPLHGIGNRKQAEDHLALEIEDLNYRQFLLQNLLFEDGHYRWRINLGFFRENAPYIIGFPDHAREPYAKPALFLAGETSNFVDSDAVYRLFPGAKISEIAASGHWLHVDAPELFCRSVAEWLNR